MQVRGRFDSADGDSLHIDYALTLRALEEHEIEIARLVGVAPGEGAEHYRPLDGGSREVLA